MLAVIALELVLVVESTAATAVEILVTEAVVDGYQALRADPCAGFRTFTVLTRTANVDRTSFRGVAKVGRFWGASRNASS